jgi:hypothetical protein
VRIVILGACRDNAAEQELERQSARSGPVMRGLAPMKNPGGLIIAYATQYLSTAADDAGGAGGLFSWAGSSPRHSPFTAALLDMFSKVGSEVDAATGESSGPRFLFDVREVRAGAAGSQARAWSGRLSHRLRGQGR